ncbi:MAG: hypothetical protein K0Q59_2396 [Paenibacillus sp.]|jgi:hypothetical protein|nr:hypothetical protein [Paenibacillus sp.]
MRKPDSRRVRKNAYEHGQEHDMDDITEADRLSRVKRLSAKPKRSYTLYRVPAQGDVLLLAIALCYVLLGLAKTWGMAAIDRAVIDSYSCAGLCFVLSYFVKLWIGWTGRVTGALLLVLYYVLLLGSAICMTVVPIAYRSVDWLQNWVLPLGDSMTFIGIGLVIAAIVGHTVWQRRKLAEAEAATAARATPAPSSDD